MKKHRGKVKKQRSRSKPHSSGNPATVYLFPLGRKIRVGELGVFDRSYPPKKKRDHTIESIRVIPESRRSPDQWWVLGEYLVYGGLLEENDAITNEGIGKGTRRVHLSIRRARL